jgi:glyoxylase-like metal-dependent hydrolase (beta-lactamase superfamily II)
MDRRQFLFAGLSAVAGSAIVSRPVRAQQRLSVLAAGRTNVVALQTGDAMVLVDSGAPELANALISSLPARATTVFNTHWHLENTGANEGLRDTGAEIVAHEITRQWMSTPTWLPAEDRYRDPRPKAAQPTKTFYTNGSMTAGAEHIEYGYLIEAHTSGDIYVFFRDANVLAVGDVASPVRDPELDYLTGAWLGGRVDAMTRLIKMSDNETRIVPGFGPVITRAQLQAEHDVMKTIYDRAVDRVRQGDSPDDMLQAGLLGDLPRTWTDPRKFAYAVHKGMWAHHNKLNANIV